MNTIVGILLKFLSSMILMSVTVYIWHKLLKKSFNIKSLNNVIAIILMSITSIFNYYFVNQYIRIFSITVFLIIIFKFLFKESIQKSIITPIVSQIITMLSEMVFVAFICFIFDMNGSEIINTQFGNFLSNLFISIIILGICYIPVTTRFYNFLIKITDKIKNTQLLMFSFLIIIIANILTMIIYYKVEFVYLLIFNTLLTLFCLYIVINTLKTNNSYNKVYNKYNMTLTTLKEYENILDKYRISNHENKNQLLTIRNMISKTNKKAISYIDEIVDNKLKDNDKVMFEASRIPSGSLRGLIYSKILLMKELKIDYELEISKEVKTIDLINLDNLLMSDICKIIGVYLDNAIQAVKDLNEKYINIEMYIDNLDLIISISNNYKGKIDINKIDNKGYTSKGEGHGYGLALTKEIINNNNRLENEKRISKEVFSQTLKIKM